MTAPINYGQQGQGTSQQGANQVAVIGAGPGGLVAARWLKSQGFEPVIFESTDRIGGQWGLEPSVSGIWEGMRTNTSRVTTAFSDLDHPEGTATFPSNAEVLAYLHRFAEMFSLEPRLRTRVNEIRRAKPGATEGGYVVTFTGPDGTTEEQTFEHVVVSSGRYNNPLPPEVPGLDTFTGAGGVSHTFAYRNFQNVQGMRVVVGGGAVSALEVAPDLAMRGAKVILSQRRQRYVLPKLITGRPSDHLVFNRFAAMRQEVVPPDVVNRGLRDFIVQVGGDPEQYGAPRPAATLEEAGVSLSQHYLPMVAEGKIEVLPWMTNVEGNRVTFGEGPDAPQREVDAITFGTGFGLKLPFLDEEIQRTLDLDPLHMDLHKYTFHPDLPGLAFVGFYELIGPYFPALEVQARWIAYAFGGTCPMPSSKEMEAGVRLYRSQRGKSQRVAVHILARKIAADAGFEAQLDQHPDLAREILFGPVSTVSYRLDGPDALDDAPERVRRAARAFGVVPEPEFSAEQRSLLAALAEASKDRTLLRLAGTVRAGA